MPQIPNAIPERIGVGGIVKLSSPCTVIIEKVGEGNVATVSGQSVYEVTEVGDYTFTSTCECKGFYAVTERGVLTGCCPTFSPPDPDTGVVTVTDENATVVAVLPTVLGVDTNTEYTFTTQPDGSTVVQPVDKDGNAVGTAQTLGTPHVTDTDTITSAFTLVDDVLAIERTDIDGTALAPLTVDLSAYVDTDTDTIVTGIAFDPATGVTTITRTDKDGTALPDLTTDMSALDTNTIQTGSTFDPLTNVLTQTFTDKDGTALPDITTDLSTLAADTAVTANTLVWDDATTSFISTITEDAVDVVGTMPAPLLTLECGDQAFVRKADGTFGRAAILPPARTKRAIVSITPVGLTGAALAAQVGQTLNVISLTIDPFVEVHDCYTEEIVADVRLGGPSFRMEDGNFWVVQYVLTGDGHDVLTPRVADQAVGGVTNHQFPIQGGSMTAFTNKTAATFSWETQFIPSLFVDATFNRLILENHRIRLTRREVVEEV